MTEPVTIRELFDLPEQIRKGDFVHKLGEGVENARATAESYVVTPRLAAAFDQALTLVGSALRDGRSQAAYLHGSFGSGKSHFMAMLSLLLAGNADAWRIPELHPLRARHDFVGTKRLLELHFHMIGQDSIEAAVFGGYVRHVARAHPEAALPGLFADEGLFDNAASLLAKLGDDAFFAPMNAGATADAGWGDFGQRWDRERLRAATTSPDPAEREALFTALVKSHFQAWERSSRSYVDLDSGLATMARHAAGLGYDAIVLFLDELILWLAGRASDAAWLHAEAQKMVKLVEAADMHRQIPLVSFIARQRNLADLVGEEYAGVEEMRLRQSLKHWEGRYDTVELQDSNLPAIVEKRILRPRDEAARKALDDAFERMRRSAGPAWNVLLGGDDQAAFRKLYPFSPALVDVLVALSNSLQRQRTAIKLLMEILVEHTADLGLGEVVRVGDLFDVLAAGQDSADGVMRSRFEAAKQIYKYQFLPMIQRQNGTDSAARCQRVRNESLRLGCSGCPEKACRSDNRLIKTLLIAALVPEVDAVKELSASRLVQLNHGTLKVPIAGTEASIVAQKLRGWAAEIGQLQVGNEADPRVRLRLEGVDLGPILDRARHADSAGARQRVLRDLLFQAMGVEQAQRTHKVEWHNVDRAGAVYFGNVRTMSPEYLRCTDDEDWRLIIDYPFDDQQFGPSDDLEALERFMEQRGGSWTVVWLPSFLSDAMEKLLGELVILEHIHESKETARTYVADLSVENQSRALIDLENLRSAKRQRLMVVLAEAYGLASARDGDLDTSRAIEQHLYLLKPGARLAARVPPSFAEAVDTYVEDLLATRWPRHPKLGSKLTKRRVEAMFDLFGKLIDSDDKRLAAERALVDEARGTLGELGLVRVTEGVIHLVEDRVLQELEQRRLQRAIEQPTVDEVRGWIDEPGKMGLPEEAEDLIVRCYARSTARTFVLHRNAYAPEAGKRIPGDVVLEKPELPGHAAWASALDQAGRVFGVTMPGRALHADNLKRFEAAVAERVRAVAAAAERLPGALEPWCALLGVEREADRVRTARSAAELCAALAGQPALRQVAVLAGYAPVTSAQAVARSLRTAGELVAVLGDRLTIGQFEALAGRRGALEGAAELLDAVAAVLRQDEILAALGERARRGAEEAQRLLAPAVSSTSAAPVAPVAPVVGGAPVAGGAPAGGARAGVRPGRVVTEPRGRVGRGRWPRSTPPSPRRAPSSTAPATTSRSAARSS
jgi:hypothetical protein